jgi:transcription antitermination factor NusG
LFPGYLFVQLDRYEAWPSIERVDNVLRLLKFETPNSEYKVPSVLPGRTMASLLAAIHLRNATPKQPEKQVLQPGSVVRIVNGALSREVAICVAHARERIVVMTHMFNRDVRVEFHAPADVVLV